MKTRWICAQLLRCLAVVLTLCCESIHVCAALADDAGDTASNLEEDPQLKLLLEPLTKQRKVPGIVAAIVQGDKLVSIAASGVRRTTARTPMTIYDKMHLGSCTKAMTATRIAMLVESGKLQWDSTIASVFPEEASQIHPDLQKATLTQLLTHRAGLPANASFVQMFDYGSVVSNNIRRHWILTSELSAKPRSQPGEEFHYSNLGYAVAGAMAEKVTGESYEQLMNDGLFKPLGMISAGFGAPGTKGIDDQPRGHQELFGLLVPQKADNPGWMGPAGTVHMSVPDWAKFASFHLRGRRGDTDLLKQDSFKVLHTSDEVLKSGARYAMGWVILEPEWAATTALVHDGSNTMWLAQIWLISRRNLALLFVTNCYTEKARQTAKELIPKMYEYFNHAHPASAEK